MEEGGGGTTRLKKLMLHVTEDIIGNNVSNTSQPNMEIF